MLGAAGAAATLAVAGCSGILGPDNSPEDPVEQFYQALNDGDSDAAGELIHSESPAEDDFDGSEFTGEAEIEVQSTSVTNDGPGGSDIRDAIGDSWSEEDLDQIVNAADSANEAALVEAEVEFSVQDTSTTETQTFVVATDDGEYKLLG